MVAEEFRVCEGVESGWCVRWCVEWMPAKRHPPSHLWGGSVGSWCVGASGVCVGERKGKRRGQPLVVGDKRGESLAAQGRPSLRSGNPWRRDAQRRP
jgi:hypothetical protein